MALFETEIFLQRTEIFKEEGQLEGHQKCRKHFALEGQFSMHAYNS